MGQYRDRHGNLVSHHPAVDRVIASAESELAETAYAQALDRRDGRVVQSLVYES